MYCITKVELKWGKPQIAIPIEEQSDFYVYTIFESFDAAMSYVQLLRDINR